MNTINYIKILFSMMTWFILIFGSLINLFEKYLPTFIVQTFRLGKFAFKGKHLKFVSALEIPKSWFRHYYNYSSILTLASLALLVKVYIFQNEVPQAISWVLDNVCGVYRIPSVTPAHTLLAMSLLTMQCLRRFYDSNFVSVFSPKSKMNLSHYLVGYIHYTGAVLAILSEAPIFAQDFFLQKSEVQLSDLSKADYWATFLFFLAFWHQYKCTVILAQLRKNSKGRIITHEHLLPEGDWFQYLSSPHMIAEILMYFSLTVILWGNITWIFIFAWVSANQVEMCLLNHWWYQENFKDFPNKRKALLPFIY